MLVLQIILVILVLPFLLYASITYIFLVFLVLPLLLYASSTDNPKIPGPTLAAAC